MHTVAMLEDLGHTVFQAHSGKEAIEVLRRENSVDLVVADQAMPKMTGTELARTMKADWPDIPVLLATGYTDKLGEEGLALPKLAKPYLQRDLSDAIARLNPARRQGERVIKLRTR